MSFKSNRFFFLLLFLFLIPLHTQRALAVEIGIGFDPSSDERAVGYKLYYGTDQNAYGVVDLGPATEYYFSNLPQGETYYFAATAYDGNQNESELSEVLVHVIASDAGGETPVLIFDPDVSSFTMEAGGKTVSQASLATSNGTAAKYTVGDNAAWLSVSPATGTTPETLSVSVDATNLSPGIYSATVTAGASGCMPSGKQVKLTVTEKTTGTPGSETYKLLVSPFSNRSSAALLNSWSGTGDIFVFVFPETGISKVSFFIDDPDMTGKPYRLEGIAPYDLAGGTSSAANPFDATRLSSDFHEITALIQSSAGGSEVATAIFSTVPDTYSQDPGSDGVVSIEAENFDLTTMKIGHEWTIVNDGACSGSQALEATPNTGSNMDKAYVEHSPRLDYAVNFAQTGTYYVWVRGLAPSLNDDSIHVGLNGQALTSAEKISNFDANWNWSNRTMDGEAAMLDITEAGLHTINVWMREDGFFFDKLVLTRDAFYVPSGKGPAETLRSEETGGASMRDLLVSFWPNRSGAALLEGLEVSGDIYVFVDPETEISRVSFFIDDPSMIKGPFRVEGIAPYDLAGGTASNANPLDSSLLSGGPHEITALVELVDGSAEVSSAVFTTGSDR